MCNCPKGFVELGEIYENMGCLSKSIDFAIILERDRARRGQPGTRDGIFAAAAMNSSWIVLYIRR